MIISVTQHDGANPVIVTPQNTRSLIVKRRHKYERYAWGGWYQRYLAETFPEGVELRIDLLKAGTWALLKPKMVGIPFENYVYLNNADGTRFEVEGGGMLLGALLQGQHPYGGRLCEHVYLVTSDAGHYFHAPDTKRQPGEVQCPRVETTPPVKPALTDGMLHRMIEANFERMDEVIQANAILK